MGMFLGPLAGTEIDSGSQVSVMHAWNSKMPGEQTSFGGSLCLCLVGDFAVYCVVHDVIVWLVRRGCAS